MRSAQLRPHSCRHCQKLVVQRTHHENTGEEVWFRRDPSSDKVVFNFTLRDLILGAAEDCKLCQWILNDEAISRASFENINASSSEGDAGIDAGTYEVLSSTFDNDINLKRSSLIEALQEQGDAAQNYVLMAATSPPFNMGMGYMSDILRIDYFGLWDADNKTIHYRTRRDLQCFADPGDPAAKEVSTRPIEPDPASSLLEISAWLKECHATHTKCQEMSNSMSKPGKKPCRLVSIDSSEGLPRIRLRDTDGLTELPQYVALSYCWGGDQPVKSTTGVLPGFMASITFETLPTTLRDAITVCVRLGYSFLWVDALCIVQDDEKEKAVEIAKMTYIYGRAAFTIAASRAGDATAGFLHPRVFNSGDRPTFALPCVCSSGEIGTLNFADMDTDVEPIDGRGWTLQERLLSTRIVEFGARQTRWTCQDNQFVGTVDGWRGEAELSHLKPKTAVLWVALDRPDGPDVGLWNHLVEIYTERKLTKSADRPLAISGIAEWFSSLTHDEYLAGIWKSHLHTGLLWSVEPKDRSKRPEKYQGPSWSWLSVNTSVWHHYHSLVSEAVENVNISLLSSSIDMKIDAAPYGAVRDGSASLMIQGKLAAAKVGSLKTLYPNDNWISFNDHVVEIAGKNDSGSCTGTADFFPDCDEPEWQGGGSEDNGQIMALEVQNSRDGPTWISHGIVLRRVMGNARKSPENVAVFSRLGNYVADTSNGQRDDESDEEWEKRIDMELNWFKNLEPVTLQLV